MAQRHSEYERIDGDRYFTPPHITRLLLPSIPGHVRTVWEPAVGGGAVADVLAASGYEVTRTDLADGDDFLASDRTNGFDAIITNPPYGNVAPRFVAKALELTESTRGFVAMLLGANWHNARKRQNILGNHPAFVGCVVITERIRWIPGSTGAPSTNHAWYLWSWRKNFNEPPRLIFPTERNPE